MKKIMFNDRYGLTEAVLSGRKTQTRRLITQPFDEKVIKFQHCYYDATFDLLNGLDLLKQYYLTESLGKLPYKVGEIVAVAQSYKDANVDFIPGEDEEFGCYNFPTEQTNGWTNKMFVRADLMPHQIRITNVRVERLQDISDEDCIKEGIYKDNCPTFFNGYAFEFCKCEDGVVLAKQWYKTAQDAYAALIDKISGKGTWKNNPFVFVYDFELIK